MCLTDTSLYIYICVKHFGMTNFKKFKSGAYQICEGMLVTAP